MSDQGGLAGSLQVREMRLAEKAEFLIRVYSMEGQLAYQTETNMDGEFVTPNLDPGNYVVEVYRTYGKRIPKDHEIYGVERSLIVRIAPNQRTKLAPITI